MPVIKSLLALLLLTTFAPMHVLVEARLNQTAAKLGPRVSPTTVVAASGTPEKATDLDSSELTNNNDGQSGLLGAAKGRIRNKIRNRIRSRNRNRNRNKNKNKNKNVNQNKNATVIGNGAGQMKNTTVA
ncbi:hypothetical protein HK102_005058 [Quaeritorhiza haematococci]|nr:hypothetical protein HK102_005058 [Quaeritorhiza haematococci]